MSTRESIQLDMIGGSIFDAAHSTPKNSVGQICRRGGNTYRYCSTAIDIAVAQVVALPAASSLTANGCAAAAVGATEVTITIASITENQFAGGRLVITDDAGGGYSYLIESHTATTANVVVVQLVDPLIVALTTASDIEFVAQPYSKVIVGTADLVPLGVAVVPALAATAATTLYFWAQTKGLSVVAVTTATSIASGVKVGTGATGGVVVNTATTATVGVAAGAADDYIPVQLSLE